MCVDLFGLSRVLLLPERKLREVRDLGLTCSAASAVPRTVPGTSWALNEYVLNGRREGERGERKNA